MEHGIYYALRSQMTRSIYTIVQPHLEEFARKHDFAEKRCVEQGEVFEIDYESALFGLSLENYHCDLSVYIYKIGFEEQKISLFNLLEYLAPGHVSVRHNSFEDEMRIEARYTKQILYILNVLETNFVQVSNFVATGDYLAKCQDLRQYMIDHYPQVFGRR